MRTTIIWNCWLILQLCSSLPWRFKACCSFISVWKTIRRTVIVVLITSILGSVKNDSALGKFSNATLSRQKRFKIYNIPRILLEICVSQTLAKLDRDVTSFSTYCRPVPFRQLLRRPGKGYSRIILSHSQTFKHVFILILFISVNCMRKSSNRLYLNFELLISWLISVQSTLYEKAFCFQRLQNHLTSISFLS